MSTHRTVEALFVYLNAFLLTFLFQELLDWPGWFRVLVTFVVWGLLAWRYIRLEKTPTP